MEIKTIMSIASSVFSAVNQISAGRAASQAGQYNAAVLEQRARREGEIGQFNAQQIARENKRLAGTQRAMLGGSGRDPSSGSALLIQEDLDEEGKLSELLAADAGEVKAQSLRQDAVLAKMKGGSAQRAGYYRAGTTLLKAAGTKFD